MSALSGEDLRRGWIGGAERLDRLGHFAKYSPKQRAEVLRKGYLGPQAPDRGIKIARRELVVSSSEIQTEIAMKCFKCAKGKMMPAIANMTARVRGEEIPVRTEAMVCNRCEFHVMTDAQSDAYTIASADAYRTKHGLLTTKELKQVRKILRMTFQAFAKYLKVGEASPKRWEAGLVQDRAMDELIRLKSDLATARENLTRLEAQLGVAPAASRPQVIVVQMPRREVVSEWVAYGSSSSTEIIVLPSDLIASKWPTA